MIGFLSGRVFELESPFLLLLVGGVGYEVQISDALAHQLQIQQDLDLYIRQIFREDGVLLCGFATREERQLFDILLEVKGCGPKVALALLGQVGMSNVTRSILLGDAKTLCLANGVGTRLAERILLETRPKIESKQWGSGSVSTPISRSDQDLIEALLNLGYRRADADRAAAEVDSSLPLDEKLKLSLQFLRKN